MAARRSEATLLPFVLTRLFDAPREAVFKAFTNPECFQHWWGPKGSAVENLRMDIRVGGMTHYALCFEGGERLWGRAIYREIEPPNRLAWINSFSDPQGGIASHAGHEGWPPQILNVIELAEEAGKTRLTLTSTPFEASASECDTFDHGHASMAGGWGGSFDRLEAALGDKPALLTVSRQFDAAPEAVFDAWLDAESIAQWLFATPGGVMEHVSVSPRVGGGFEVFERRGSILAEHYGTFVEIERPHRLAFDFRSGKDTPTTRVTITFDPRDGGCLVTLTHELDAAWAQYSERVKAGWAGILQELERTLQGESVSAREIVQMREFEAPREKVWEAWTTPKHVDQWWGPDGFTTRTETMEVRPDGRWRFTMTAADGTVFPNFVLFMDVAAPERLIYAHGSVEDEPPHFYVTINFEALAPARTRVTLTSRFPTKAARDLVVEKFGAIEGGKQTLAHLARYLESML